MPVSASATAAASAAADRFRLPSRRASSKLAAPTRGAGSAASILEHLFRDGDHGAVASFLRSHPLIRERTQRIRTLAGSATTDRPILAGQDWALLKFISRNGPTTSAP